MRLCRDERFGRDIHMTGHSIHFRSRFLGLCLAGATALLGRLAHGDSVWIQSGTGNPIALSDVKVIGVQDDSLVFTAPSGKQTSKLLTQVPQIKVDDEPAFSAAEEAYRAKDFKTALENYQKALETSTKDWLKDRSALRLVQSANGAGNFPAAVHGFILLAQSKPGAATENKPAVPANRAAIDQAIAELKQATQDAKLSGDRKTVLNNYLVELYTAKGDAAGAAGQMAKADPAAAAAASSARNAESQKVAADARLTEARQAFAQRQFAKAAQVLNANGAVFTDARQRADALYLLAQCTAAGAGDDPAQLKDAALAYMRVVGACDAVPGKPHVVESLMAVGGLMEKLKSDKEAAAVYGQVVAEFPGTPAATQAKQNADRLAAAAPKN